MRSTLLPGICLAAALALPGASHAQLIDMLDQLQMGKGGGTPVINIAPTLELEPITAAEMLLNGAAIDDTGALDAILDSSFAAESLGSGAFAAGGLGSVVRSVDPVWWSWMKKKDFDRLNVQYELRGSNGSAYELSSVDQPTSVILVALEPIAPKIVDKDKSRRLVHGAFRLTLDLANVRAAGRHTGTLTVIVNNL